MEKLIEEMSSTYWWLGVVVVGIIINIVSGYLKKTMESGLVNVSSYWKNKKTKRDTINNKKIEILQSNSELRIIYSFRETRYRIRSISFILFGSILLSMGFYVQIALTSKILSIVTLTIGLISFLIGMDDHASAMKVKSLVEKSVDGLDELDQTK